MKKNNLDKNNSILTIKDLSIAYVKGKYAVKNVSAEIEQNAITAIMGPSGCGKSTLLRAINRMHELYPNISTEGEIFLNKDNIYDMDTINLRRKVGMVFQRPNPFPTLSIYDNVIAGYKLNGIKLKKNHRDEIVEKSLTDVSLWTEVKDSLFDKGTFLSGGQQQRLCIARALAYLKPGNCFLSKLRKLASAFVALIWRTHAGHKVPHSALVLNTQYSFLHHSISSDIM